jgi:hypothetical protein
MTGESGFENALAPLHRHGVEYLLVGGLAVALNGFVRTTEDVDILIHHTPDNIRRLLAALAEFGQGHGATLTPEDFTDEPGAIRVIEEFPLDIFTLMNGLRYADLLPHRRIHQAGNLPIPYADAPGLIRIKSGSHREKDRIDLDALRRLGNQE